MNYFVLTRQAINQLGINNPSDAIGRPISVSRFQGNIVGVVENFHNNSMHEKNDPVAFFYLPRFFYEVYIKMAIEKLHSLGKMLTRIITLPHLSHFHPSHLPTC